MGPVCADAPAPRTDDTASLSPAGFQRGKSPLPSAAQAEFDGDGDGCGQTRGDGLCIASMRDHAGALDERDERDFIVLSGWNGDNSSGSYAIRSPRRRCDDTCWKTPLARSRIVVNSSRDQAVCRLDVAGRYGKTLAQRRGFRAVPPPKAARRVSGGPRARRRQSSGGRPHQTGSTQCGDGGKCENRRRERATPQSP